MATIVAPYSIVAVFGYVGRKAIRFLIHLSNIAYLAQDTLYWLCIAPWRGRPLRRHSIAQEMEDIGVRSFPLICVTSLSLGAVLVVLMGPQFRTFGIVQYMPSIITVFLIRELSPLLTGIVLAGRVGAAVTARLGTMKVTDEILALEIMAINPVGYLVVPRFIAAIVMLPCLTILADVIGLAASLTIATGGLGLSFSDYLDGTLHAFTVTDILFSLFKSLIFAFLIVFIACYEGIIVEGGAEGVGRATMTSVVTSTIMVIVADGMLSLMFYRLL